MKHQLQPDDTDARSRPRSGVIKAAKPASLHDHETRRQRPVARSNARKAVDRASDALQDQSRRRATAPRAERLSESVPAERQEPKRSAIKSRIAERAKRQSAELDQTQPLHQASVDAPPVAPATARWYQSRWIKYSLMGAAVALMVAVAFLKPIDNSSESQIDSALTRALVGFGIARTLNGVISVAQGTEFAVQPAGVGVNFSPGEILDPVNDLVERFSWVMLVATSSLGVQKILLEVSSWIGISFMLAGAAVFWLLTRMQSGAASSVAKFASRVLLVMLLLRFLIPVGSIANDWVYRQFLQPKFETSSQQLEVASERIREISTRQSNPPEESSSLRQKAKNIYQSMTSKFDFDGMLQDYKKSAEDVSEHAVNLIVVFLLQTILFPLIFLYVVYRAFRYLLLPPSNA
jgi:hypothetical protein